MKVSWFILSIIVISFLTLVLYSCVFSEEDKGQILTILNKGQTLPIKTGNFFMVVLNNPGPGGYIVQDPPEFDPQVLNLLKMESRASKNSNLDGNFGEIVWTFQASKQGDSHIKIKAVRPWEKNKKSIEIFEATIMVSK